MYLILFADDNSRPAITEFANEPSARTELDPALREHAPILANLL
jgi:hypothetical protein